MNWWLPVVTHPSFIVPIDILYLYFLFLSLSLRLSLLAGELFKVTRLFRAFAAYRGAAAELLFRRKYSVGELSAVGRRAVVQAPSLIDFVPTRLANGLWTTANGLNAPQLPRERKKKQTV